jgi:hypothetical protein
MRPSRRAESNPAFVRSRRMARSNSANAPTICIIIRGVVGLRDLIGQKAANPSRNARRVQCSFALYLHGNGRANGVIETGPKTVCDSACLAYPFFGHFSNGRLAGHTRKSGCDAAAERDGMTSRRSFPRCARRESIRCWRCAESRITGDITCYWELFAELTFNQPLIRAGPPRAQKTSSEESVVTDGLRTAAEGRPHRR